MGSEVVIMIQPNCPSAWKWHSLFVADLINIIRPVSVVELGVHWGFSYLTMCETVKKLNIDCRCYGIDTWLGDNFTGRYGSEVYDFVVRENEKYAAFSQLIRLPFDAATESFRCGSIDIIHFDGSHDYPSVKNDWHKWSPMLTNRGIALFHDTQEDGMGVKKMFAELSNSYRHFEFEFCHGLGVLAVGQELSLPGLFDNHGQILSSWYGKRAKKIYG